MHDLPEYWQINSELLHFKGCSSSELGVVVGVSAIYWLPASLVLARLAGAVTMGFGIGIIDALKVIVS